MGTGVCRDVVTPRFLESSSKASAMDESQTSVQAVLHMSRRKLCLDIASPGWDNTHASSPLVAWACVSGRPIVTRGCLESW